MEKKAKIDENQIMQSGCAISEIQKRYDEVAWEIDKSEIDKLIHIHLHLSRTIGKLATICENIDHKRRVSDVSISDIEDKLTIRDISADLIHHSSQISNLFGYELGSVVLDRYRRNSLRFAPDSEFSEIIDSDFK